jgi:hypothetical protein
MRPFLRSAQSRGTLKGVRFLGQDFGFNLLYCRAFERTGCTITRSPCNRVGRMYTKGLRNAGNSCDIYQGNDCSEHGSVEIFDFKSLGLRPFIHRSSSFYLRPIWVLSFHYGGTGKERHVMKPGLCVPGDCALFRASKNEHGFIKESTIHTRKRPSLKQSNWRVRGFPFIC